MACKAIHYKKAKLDGRWSEKTCGMNGKVKRKERRKERLQTKSGFTKNCQPEKKKNLNTVYSP